MSFFFSFFDFNLSKLKVGGRDACMHIVTVHFITKARRNEEGTKWFNKRSFSYHHARLREHNNNCNYYFPCNIFERKLS